MFYTETHSCGDRDGVCISKAKCDEVRWQVLRLESGGAGCETFHPTNPADLPNPAATVPQLSPDVTSRCIRTFCSETLP